MDQLAFDVFAKNCPSRTLFDRIFSRWGLLVLGRLGDEPVRFGTLRRAIGGISEKMLSQTLKVLEEQNLVARTEWPEKPPRVEYLLTDSGKTIAAGVHHVISDLYKTLEQKQNPSSN